MGIGQLPERLTAYALLNHINETLFIADGDLRIMWMNEIATKKLHPILPLYGFDKPENMIGQSVLFFSENNRTFEDFSKPIRRRITIKNHYVAEAMISPVTLEDGIRCYILILADVTASAHEENEQAELLASLSTPHMKIWDGIIAIPITGLLTDERADKLKEDVLFIALREKADYMLINVSALRRTDERTSFYLTQLADALRLMGITTYFVGVSPDLAIDAAHSVGEWRTFQTAKDALLSIMDDRGISIH